MTAHADLAAMRKTYAQVGLSEQGAALDPFEQFARWLSDAIDAGLSEPNAMVLATASRGGVPNARTVLLKGVDGRGFTFFTNMRSPKGQELTENPLAALVFPWHSMARQVRVTGSVSELPRAEVSAYFSTRPHASQLGAWASPQSQVMDARQQLEQRWAEAGKRFPAGADVPPPDFWGGYRVAPEAVEFWVGRDSRLHDRLRYRRTRDGWLVERLAP
jgi:pyridoxamine 5'-phosphate oxidase